MEFKGRTLAAALALAALPLSAWGDGKDKPSLSLRASPAIAFTPARILVTAELRNVTDDAQALHCPTLEWDWGDGTQSVSSSDCGPYEPGVSRVQTRYTKQNVFNTPGRFRVTLRLKQGSTTVLAGSTTVTARPGGLQMY